MSYDLKTITVLFRAKNSLETLIKQDVQSYGVNVSEFGTLEALYHKGALTVQQIIDKVLIANSSMTYVLDNLTKRGLITRTKDPLDKRIFKVELTPEGKAFMDQIYPQHEANMKTVLSILSKEEQQSLQSLLKILGLSAKNFKCTKENI